MLGLMINAVVLVSVLISVAFFTLFERKVLSYMQGRKGPNKVSFIAIGQPIGDAIKLFTKEMVWPLVSNRLPYLVAPVMSLIIALLLWQVFPMDSSSFSLSWGVMLFLCLSSLNVYGTLMAGWSSNSKYALFGALRAAAQTISYEVSLALVLLFVFFLLFKLSFVLSSIWFFSLMFPVSLIWFASCAAETNRAPFDFAEGESELVSGFNVEYSAVGFALIFLAEYGNIILMSMLTSVVFFGGPFFLWYSSSSVIYSVKIVFFCFCFIWLRATFPRFRYDRLMGLTWKGFLPFSLSLLLVVSIVQSVGFIV
uniref:NADH-ubiquinone oxidoreductase chain 1 n=1 Tax=Patella ferruginea TaxID=87961 RepID=A0A481MVL5_PATFE|nr:NADH dehydrogenase subunit 1 [Patella ferruginea]